ncbi:uncharacterized protein DUF4432 [Halanaerobium saccharolyticum]|uniref:Uncharacterized protein DUF4432 n=1 Tax=Halanaerobium saccharolyticum TaxID=43595 RepID=A0A4R6LZ90_9FIRM|nr:aldose 1-epimerase family protein [Halanaerobium saccharolyticum]TDO94133.1 uncharacterized protein DUF4432 [Halanaerobium saccharolyticum]
MNLFNRDYSIEDLRKYFGSLEQLAGLRKYSFSQGKAKNVEVVEFRTGSGLRFEVLVDRGLDIGLCEFKGIPISFRSSVGEASPFLFEAEGDQWFRNFSGGLLTGCGLTYLGAPDIDQGQKLGLHGRISNIPAESVSTFEEKEGESVFLNLKGRVRETKTLSTNLLLERTISAELGKNKIRIHDTITNEGFTEEPLMFLYHINLGHPLVDKGTKLHSDSLNVQARDDISARYLNNYETYLGPTPDYPDVVFYHDVRENENGFCEVSLKNTKLGLAFKLKYRKENLPNFVQWKYTNQGNYVTGLEPSNSKVEGRSKAREEKELEYIEPGEHKEYFLEMSIEEL